MSEIVKIYPYKYTPQEELFCELYADTGIISKAYHLAMVEIKIIHSMIQRKRKLVILVDIEC